MWFRNIQLYRLPSSFSINEHILRDALDKKPFTQCLASQESSVGWASPIGKLGEELLHCLEGRALFALKEEAKLVPTSVVNEVLTEKVEEIEQQESRKLGGKEKRQLKDDLRLSLLPRAFSRKQTTLAYIDFHQGLLVINASSSKKAENLIMLLRECMGSLPVTPFAVATSPSAVMTNWLSNGVCEGKFEIGQACELHATTDEGGVVKISKQNLQSDEIDAHISAGKVVTSMALEFDERLSFTLKDSMEIKAIKYLDAVVDQLEDIECEDPIAEFEAQFSLMVGEINTLLPPLADAMGGELLPV